MRAIFISYRRDDAEGQAGRLFKDLVAHFGTDAVFMDVTGIAAGIDFRNVIEQHVTSCGVLLSLIGKDWLSATDELGKRRLEDATDFVRLETASALKRDIPVIPVLVQGARMPRPEQLPPDLEALAYRNAVELTHARWDSDVRLLVEALKPHVNRKGSAPREQRSDAHKTKWISAAAVAALTLAVGLYVWLPRDVAMDAAAMPTEALPSTESDEPDARPASPDRPLAPVTSTAAAVPPAETLPVETPPAETSPETSPVSAPRAAVDQPASARMLLYQHSGYRDGSPTWPITAQEIGTGWNFKQTFAGDGGAIYAIQDDGKMLFYRHRGAEWPVQNAEIGEGWNFKQVFAGDGGAIYAIQDDGRMLFYRHEGIADGSARWPIAGVEIGAGWNFKQAFAGAQGLVYVITL